MGLTLTCDADDDTLVLYLIRTADNKLYTGITTDVDAAISSTKAAKGRKHCAGKETDAGVFCSSGRSFAGVTGGIRVKQLTKRQKERLVAEGAGLQSC